MLERLLPEDVMRRALAPVLGFSLLTIARAASADGIEDANNAVRAAQGGKYDQAIALFTQAIDSDELNLTGRAQAFAYRGIARAATADYTGAKEDLDLAVALDTGYNPEAYAYRGYFEMVTGDAAKGAADLEKSARLKVWSYQAIWLALARAKAHLSDTDDISLKANSATIDMDRWPGPVIRFLLDEAPAASVAPAAQAGDPSRLKERTCDADFYVAESDLAHGDAARAKPLLMRAADNCPFASFERMGATAELMRMK
jgi:lipoprotein NlpI